ncbi:hypothetical protein MF672_048785 [Actinomadura sp. ATCC 31491]|uniref:Integral membrane protein n=1 Tax=Actinomadura luzonensis TaxID=2805427 RepID=A0ABT0GAM2_9ACTN|nr:hypothetical protein [Actinomadura luzonensis]MCK2221651.1 hypothetical protein [Actinomadura luzonensis]
MLALSLGAAWLLLAPLSLWLLVRGRAVERAGALVTLLLLEGGTVAMGRLTPHVMPDHTVVAHDVPPVRAACQERAPTPRSAKLGRSLVLTWPAGRHECDTAEVAMRAKGRRLLLWLHTERTAAGGPPRTMQTRVRQPGAPQTLFTLPVHVKGHTAAVTVPLPLPRMPGRVPVDGRSGHRIPLAATSAAPA